jgi:hypothetical protein
MRRSLAAMMLAVGALVPGAARADVVFPAIPANLDPSTVVWFNGCTNALEGACVTAGVARKLPNQPNPTQWLLFYNFLPQTTPSGVQYDVLDSWSWHSFDNTCVGGTDMLFWDQSSCVITHLKSETFAVQISWNRNVLPQGEQRALVTLSPLATPEPASIALVATGLLTISGVGAARRRLSSSEKQENPS